MKVSEWRKGGLLDKHCSVHKDRTWQLSEHGSTAEGEMLHVWEFQCK